jgi:acyl-CoA synthetase (AMP-forming)/AMP-acid ligase II
MAMIQTWAGALETATDLYPDKPAFLFEGAGWEAALGFVDWRDASALFARGLSALGVVRGDRVAILCPGSPVWPVLQVACSRLGAVLVPVNVRYRLDEIAFVITKARPRVLFTIDRIRDVNYPELVREAVPADGPVLVTLDGLNPTLSSSESAAHDGSDRLTWGQFLAIANQADAAEDAGRPEDPVLLQFTSGTTSFPKGALLSNVATLTATEQLNRRMGTRAEDHFFSTQPFYHVGGSVATTLPPLVVGCTMLVPERYTVEAAFTMISKYEATVRVGQAAMYAQELAHPDFDPAHYRSLRRGWAAGTPVLKRMIVERMGIVELTSNYGLTETAGTATAAGYWHDEVTRLDTCGPAIDEVEIEIRDSEGAAVPTGESGEVCVRGPVLMSGYFEDPAATAEVLDADGWFRTGDVGRLDEQGNLHFVDRIKDMIKPGGENVSAAEVERVIATMPEVAQVAVVGAPDDRLGEVPVAFVELRHDGSLTEPAVIEQCGRMMASFKVPRRVIFVTNWPMTESGKIQKFELKKTLGNPSDEGLVGKSG